jgi:hypothetical protein
VAAFDVAQLLPWDAGFHAWTEAHPDPLEGTDLSGISPVLRDALIRLKLPDCWRVLEEPELPEDPCRVVLQSVGPNVAKVREIVDTYVRMRGLAAVDPEGEAPLVVASPLPRVAAVLMRRSLLEAGALAEVEKLP